MQESVLILKFEGPDSKFFQVDNKRNFGNLLTYLIYLWNSFVFILSESTFTFLLFYLIIALMAYRYSHFYYSFQLIEITVNYFKKNKKKN